MQDGRFKVKIRFRTVLLLIAVFLLSVWSSAHAEIEIGDEAPDFTLPNTENESITLSDHRGSENVIVIFYRGVF